MKGNSFFSPQISRNQWCRNFPSLSFLKCDCFVVASQCWGGWGAGWALSVSHAWGWRRSGEVRLSAGLGAAFQTLHLWSGKSPCDCVFVAFSSRAGSYKYSVLPAVATGKQCGCSSAMLACSWLLQGSQGKDWTTGRYWSPSQLCQRRGNKHECAPARRTQTAFAGLIFLNPAGVFTLLKNRFWGWGGSSKRNHAERKRQPKSGAQSHDCFHLRMVHVWICKQQQPVTQQHGWLHVRIHSHSLLVALEMVQHQSGTIWQVRVKAVVAFCVGALG